MIKQLKRLNTDQILRIAIAISFVLHLAFFMVIFVSQNTEQQSSLGSARVILLENMADQPVKLSDQITDTQAASQASAPGKSKGINGEQAKPEDNSQQNTANIISPHKENRIAKNTNNKGALVDQSGTDLTPEDQYRQLITQHLVKKIKNAPTQGQAIVHLHILKVGIATRVNIDLINGPKHYQQWLKQQVLNANPLPAFPSNIKKASVTLAIKISHQTD